MNLQIFGTKKCKDSKKAQLFFQERRIPFQFINLQEKEMSKGELRSILGSVKLDDLIDTESKVYEDKNLKYMLYDKEEALLTNPLLFKTPIVRDGKRATIGFVPEIWKQWINDSKK
ncbi:ArsC family transcriptional regulator [Leptospira biflexa]|jgi:arsenate reductase-like glutaredoxin family protein|uniref:Putative arsenate reductase-like protein n=1 Tax=Leptospira biflexa serovar Patoc (strain Patoc 1 / ATCC 23582 / Paris) TaxID=456481 RepID=B0SM08_LEPBP|nr:ArsC/Spx/MgsR family protein [Leptospira biflexa]ABZ94964.1 Glutaredoxin family protein [Leptospira biflexa serovar Patoc strain 'Patoc 1 (Ames)']ABZ98638.1 Putative arsenate reductase-like protein [Leptospira biflexa serovar Patoc strain 'Patoc 1 (Paris)']TGM32289.1 ArsC family transcriptional regulator [Leptospira biflexa]TGM33855.1 ArsC family transcriptional regulator [Leptospira biflexa]TGM42588.1 ArsC family transcriptional regulator [Leptospira biflexa]